MGEGTELAEERESYPKFSKGEEETRWTVLSHLLNCPQVPDLSNIKTEAELYTYLKDGTELCRMIGIVTKGTVLEKITYR